MDESADKATEAAKAAVEETSSRIDDFLARRRRAAQTNDAHEEEGLRRYQAERAEAVRIRNRELRLRFAQMGVSSEAVEAFLASLPETIL